MESPKPRHREGQRPGSPSDDAYGLDNAPPSDPEDPVAPRENERANIGEQLRRRRRPKAKWPGTLADD
jgi:hypothetical protein